MYSRLTTKQFEKINDSSNLPDMPKVRALYEKLITAPEPYEGKIPTKALIKDLTKEWLGDNNLFVCQNIDSPCQVSCKQNRCSNKYWIKHSVLVSHLMGELAKTLGLSEERQNLYYVAGRLHDLDYLSAPHNVSDSVVDERHSVPLVENLCKLEVPPILSLAILEHSPHLGLDISSRLSAGLIACDEAATLYAFGYDLEEFSEVPKPVKDILKRKVENNPITKGTVRGNVVNRMQTAFKLVMSSDYNFKIAG